jgi:hypothetical protein
MDKKLQKEMLIFIRDTNNTLGTSYNRIVDDISKEFIDKRKINNVKVMNNLKLLGDSGKIEGNFEKDQFNPHGPLRITVLGYEEFKPWYAKFWKFFTNDFAKILSVIAIILSIIATILSLLKK